MIKIESCRRALTFHHWGYVWYNFDFQTFPNICITNHHKYHNGNIAFSHFSQITMHTQLIKSLQNVQALKKHLQPIREPVPFHPWFKQNISCSFPPFFLIVLPKPHNWDLQWDLLLILNNSEIHLLELISPSVKKQTPRMLRSNNLSHSIWQKLRKKIIVLIKYLKCDIYLCFNSI